MSDLKNNSVPMVFVGVEVDPSAHYSVVKLGVDWVVKRDGERIGELPRRLVDRYGPLSVATDLIGLGAFVSRRVFGLGARAWASESFSSVVDAEVASL